MERLLRCWLCPIFYLNGDFACIWLMYLLVCKLHLTFSHTHKNCNNSKDFNCNACNLWLSSPFIQFMITQSIYSPISTCFAWIRLLVCVCVLVTQSCPTLCNPVDCSPPGSSVHGILQARMLEWVAVLLPRGSFQPRDWAWSPLGH